MMLLCLTLEKDTFHILSQLLQYSHSLCFYPHYCWSCIIFAVFRGFWTFSPFAGTSYTPSWTHSKAAIRMELNQALTTVDGLLLYIFWSVSYQWHRCANLRCHIFSYYFDAISSGCCIVHYYGTTDHSSMNATFVLLLAFWSVSLSGYQVAQSTQTLETLFLFFAGLTPIVTLLYVSIITVKWIYDQRKFGMAFVRRLYAWRHGYETVQ